ncbi:MAG TPA: hypothetical protein VGG06_10450 [Thermoanaerobaculia bacterium]
MEGAASAAAEPEPPPLSRLEVDREDGALKVRAAAVLGRNEEPRRRRRGVDLEVLRTDDASQ